MSFFVIFYIWDIPSLLDLQPHKDELIGEWHNMLAHQLPQLPPVEKSWDALSNFFDWLMDTTKPVYSRDIFPFPPEIGMESVHVPIGSTHIYGRNTAFLEIIRFSASNHLCTELDYTDEKGKRASRLIEPYSLRRTKDGHFLLMAIKPDSGGSRAYRVDRIHGVKMSNRTFLPRYQIELLPTLPNPKGY